MDGYDYFDIKQPHQGLISIKKSLDYETNDQLLLKIMATDSGTNRLSSITLITVNVLDGDDQNPFFVQKNCKKENGHCINVEYYATITSDSPVSV